jgi:hypothetical protein
MRLGLGNNLASGGLNSTHPILTLSINGVTTALVLSISSIDTSLTIR